MNDTINTVVNRKQDVAAFVRFDRVAVEDHVQSLSTGRYVAKDVDYVFITPPYSKDEVVKKASSFLADNKLKVSLGHLSPAMADRYEAQYKAWQTGQELPIDGTPIKCWAMISPAQQAMLIDRKILTVESLSKANDDGMRLIGMGGHGMRKMAQDWLSQAEDKGPLTMEMKTLRQENDVLKGSVETLARQVESLKSLVGQPHAPTAPVEHPLSASSLLSDDDEPTPKPTTGRKR